MSTLGGSPNKLDAERIISVMYISVHYPLKPFPDWEAMIEAGSESTTRSVPTFAAVSPYKVLV